MSKINRAALMAQYAAIKGKHPDALLLIRVGDFYETFGEDAKTVSRVLKIALLDIETSLVTGFPSQSLDAYLPMLVRMGHKVAIAEKL